MKRAVLHICFWLIYITQDALFEFLWSAPVLTAFDEKTRFVMAVNSAVAAALPKIFFSYIVAYFFIERIIKGYNKSLMVGGIVLTMFVTLVLYRCIFNYYVYSVVYVNIYKLHPLLDLPRLLLGLMDIGFASGMFIALRLLRERLVTKDREKNLVKEKLETELKFLRSQTNPHFLFNTLNNIYALARKKSEDTPEVVMKLSKLLRFMLYESGKGLITIADEIKVLDDYLELEKIRYNERLTISFEKDIDDAGYKLAPLLLLPLVENAFKHGVSETRFVSFVHIKIKLDSGKLHFTIENTKENGDTSAITDNIGLGSLRRQLELTYKDYDLHVKNNKGLFKVELFINLATYAKI